MIPSPEPSGDPARLVFFGSGAFAVPILDAVLDVPDVVVVGVVSAPDRPAGRRGVLTAVPVAARVRELGLPLLQPPSLRTGEVLEEILALRPDVGALADYGKLVPPAILDVPRLGILNVHPSLLPRHRGASPIPATILAGDRETGVSIIRMDAGLDTGDIVAVERWRLHGTETTPELEARAAESGADLLRRTLPAWLESALEPRPQPADGVTLTRPLRREDGRLDPARPADLLERQVRAFQPWPGSFVESPRGRLVVWAAAADPPQPGDAPGRPVADDDDLVLPTVAGRLRLLEVQPAGGRRMSAAAFLRGRRADSGAGGRR